jgi:hypothetical protein
VKYYVKYVIDVIIYKMIYLRDLTHDAKRSNDMSSMIVEENLKLKIQYHKLKCDKNLINVHEKLYPGKEFMLHEFWKIEFQKYNLGTDVPYYQANIRKINRKVPCKLCNRVILHRVMKRHQESKLCLINR